MFCYSKGTWNILNKSVVTFVTIGKFVPTSERKDVQCPLIALVSLNQLSECFPRLGMESITILGGVADNR